MRDSIRLKHYEGVKWPLGEDDVTPEKIGERREELRREREVGLVLERENEGMDCVLMQLRDLVKSEGALGFLAAGGKRTDTTPLSTTAEFSASQLPGLKVLIRELRAKMALLPDSVEELRVRDVPGSTSDEERRRYVEGVAKRAVRENLGRSERSESGLGSRRTIGEVRALERLVGDGGRDGSEADVD